VTPQGRHTLPAAIPAHLAERLRTVRAAIQGRRDEQADALSDVDMAGRDDEHDPDGVTAAFEHALRTGLVTSAEQELRQLERAVARALNGTYGVCKECGSAIAEERLKTAASGAPRRHVGASRSDSSKRYPPRPVPRGEAIERR